MNIKVVHNIKTPIEVIEGVKYISAEKPFTNEYLAEVIGSDDFVAMPLTKSSASGVLVADRRASTDPTLGYAIISKEDAIKLSDRKRYTSYVKQTAEKALYNTLRASFCELP